MFAVSLRRLFHDHPQAAPLVLQRKATTRPALTVVHAYLERLRDAGFTSERAGAILRSLLSYAVGYGAAELPALGWPEAGTECAPRSHRDCNLTCLRLAPGADGRQRTPPPRRAPGTGDVILHLR